jgi:hypothetical protein
MEPHTYASQFTAPPRARVQPRPGTAAPLWPAQPTAPAYDAA